MMAFVIDAFDFARQNERREGQIAVADLARLVKESANATGTLHWSLTGSDGKFGNLQLLLSVSTTIQVVCQRCLQPLALDIRSESKLVLAKNEADADKIEEMLDDDAFDVIVGSKEMNLLDLIEDEVLLALPLSPKHDVCPDATTTKVMDRGNASPFAVLKGLKS
jgi:uncharacterized protein